jgi:hypothetical protein
VVVRRDSSHWRLLEAFNNLPQLQAFTFTLNMDFKFILDKGCTADWAVIIGAIRAMLDKFRHRR